VGEGIPLESSASTEGFDGWMNRSEAMAVYHCHWDGVKKQLESTII